MQRKILSITSTFMILAAASTLAQAEGDERFVPNKPFALAPLEVAYSATADLSRSASPLLSLYNEDAEQSLTVEVVAIDGINHLHRRHTLHLEPQGASHLGFDSFNGFDRVVLLADRPFAAELADGIELAEASWT